MTPSSLIIPEPSEARAPQNKKSINFQEPAKSESAKQEFEEPERECKIDYNRAKEDIAEGLAMFIISAPIALVLFRKTKNLL